MSTEEGRATWSSRAGQGFIYLVTAFVLLTSAWALFAAYALVAPGYGMGAVAIGYLAYLTAIPHLLGLIVPGSWVASKGWRDAMPQRPVGLIYPAGGDVQVSADGVYFGKIEQIAQAGERSERPPRRSGRE